MKIKLNFPTDFVWGSATSAYQIEGGIDADGKKDSIWDVFCRKPGAIYNGETGEIATDHYHRWKEDIALMKEIGIKSYRFSISWPRIIPDGDGKPNAAGIAFYNRLIDELLINHIEPVITLYHWDLPQSLQEKGGWSSRKTVDAFVRYASIVFEKFSDRVKLWITHNEPDIVVRFGHLMGIHAPSIQDSAIAMATAHHILLSHGAAVQAMRKLASSSFDGKIGIAVNISAVHPQDPSRIEDLIAAKKYDLYAHRLFLDSLFKGKYPEEILKEFPLESLIYEGDMQMICEPIDFLGINYYSRTTIRGEKNNHTISAVTIPPKPNSHSLMWDFYPQGLQEVVEDVWKTYAPKEIFITENGTAVPDTVTEEGEINDIKRIEYLEAHLQVIHQLLELSIPIKGYYAWSLMDNFEWSLGYQMRFGLIYVDYPSLQRTIKASGFWYKNVIRHHAISYLP